MYKMTAHTSYCYQLFSTATHGQPCLPNGKTFGDCC